MKSDLLTLYDIAHARSGDKGANSNIGVIAYTKEGYDYLFLNLTAQKVFTFFQALKPLHVVRFELPNLLAFNFVLHGILAGGGSKSLRLDAQGKALGQALLEMPLEIPSDLAPLCKKNLSKGDL